MTFDDLSKGLQAVLDGFAEWFDICRHPLLHCDKLLSLETDKEKIDKSLHLWLVVFLITLVLQLPLWKIAGIGWENVGFHLPNFLVATAGLMLIGVVLHLGLRIYGVPSNFADTLVIYTTVGGVYSPLFLLVAYPAVVPIMTSMKNAKGQGLAFIPAMAFIFSNQMKISQPTGLQGVLYSVLTIPLVVGSFLVLTLMAHKVAAKYSVPKSKTLASFGFSMSVLMTPLWLGLVSLSYFIMYTFSGS